MVRLRYLTDATPDAARFPAKRRCQEPPTDAVSDDEAEEVCS